MRRKRSLTQLYRDAARVIDQGDIGFSCVAVLRVSMLNYRGLQFHRHFSLGSNPEVLRYCKVFAPRNLWGFARKLYRVHNHPDEMKQHRVMMLLFMAEAWRDFE